MESSRCEKWHKPGLLLIGDAVEAANVLTKSLRESQERLVDVDEKRLAAVQWRRELPT